MFHFQSLEIDTHTADGGQTEKWDDDKAVDSDMNESIIPKFWEKYD